ncbi:hypothetical protein AWB67_06537 [Caballeronia terrestris]|uniref:Lipoprotein n=1 Tax=Caballeronia terrestris TaxID=1226301 RepID=A0A158KT69_9BURK|nr:hypothetical protein [Caballeronia terrestris]SAL83913.1 hypothetical protein AWB67_06537 [Caballeronia terrestris]
MRGLIVLALLLSSSMASFADDHQDRPQRRVLQVFDANGKAVGAFKYAGGGAGVFMTVNGAPVFVPVIRRQVAGTGNQTIYSATEFEWGWYFFNQFYAADCSGSPLISDRTGPRPSFTLRRGSDVTVYIAPTTNSQYLSVSSYLLGTNSQCQRYTTPVTAAGWPIESSYVITQDHPEPLSIHY